MAVLRKASSKFSSSVPTMLHVARLAGVGLGTASRALSGDGYIKKDTADRVRQAADSLGYLRNEVARSLKAKRSGAIGIVIPDIGGPFMVSWIRGAQKVLRQSNYISMIAFTDGDEAVEKEEIEYLICRQIDGLIVVPAASDAKHFHSKQFTNIPVVAFDQPILGTSFDSILVRNRTGAAGAVQHLIDHGHKRIACIGVHSNLYSIQKRIEGYRDAIIGGRLRETLAIVDPADEDGIAKQIDRWLGQRFPPTAIFSLNELTSIGVVEALASRGVHMPDEMAFISFDEISLGRYLDPPVTAVVQPGFELGRSSAARLLERIEANNLLPAKRILLDTQLVIRGSCGGKADHAKIAARAGKAATGESQR